MTGPTRREPVGDLMEDGVAHRFLVVDLDEVTTERDDLFVPPAESEPTDRAVPAERPGSAQMGFDEAPTE